MGQYHKVFNLDKKEFIHGHRIGNGLKLMEQVGFEKCTASAVWLLLAACNGRGGGDARDNKLIGRWAGDRLAVIGDYSNPDDLPGINAQEVYSGEGYSDISAEVKALLDSEFEGEPAKAWG